MTNLFERGVDLVARVGPAVAGGQIVYSRAGETVSLPAIFGQTAYSVDDGTETRLEKTDRDFLVQASRLVLGGVLVIPRAGDRIAIIDERGAEAGVYEARPVASGPMNPEERVYRRCDPEGRMLRVHAKRMSA